MRTMLISLVCIFSLSQFAIAELIDIKDKECGEIYYCYVPENCIDETKKNDPLSGLSVVEVKKDVKITNDCQALIRYHLYATSWVHMEIESFQKLDDVKSIELKQIDMYITKPGYITLKNKFSCFLNEAENVIQAIHSKDIPHSNPKKTSNILRYESDTTNSEKLFCKFDIKTSRQTEIIESDGYNLISMKINNDETHQVELELQKLQKCDPRDIKFSHEHDETKLIEMVQSRPGHFFCKDNFQIECRTDPNSNVFKPLPNGIICERALFNIEGIRRNIIDARCSLDLSYSCDYNLKWSGKETPTVQSKPDTKATPKVKTELKCPEEAPNLIILDDSDIPRQIKNPNFVCKHNGGEPFWFIGKERFTKEGPPVHCTNKLKCNFMIQENNVHDGDLGINNLPKCFKDGTLKVGNEKVNEMKCDEKSGDYKYTVNGRVNEWRIIEANTIFECDYPKPTQMRNAKARINKHIFTGSSLPKVKKMEEVIATDRA